MEYATGGQTQCDLPRKQKGSGEALKRCQRWICPQCYPSQAFDICEHAGQGPQLVAQMAAAAAAAKAKAAAPPQAAPKPKAAGPPPGSQPGSSQDGVQRGFKEMAELICRVGKLCDGLDTRTQNIRHEVWTNHSELMAVMRQQIQKLSDVQHNVEQVKAAMEENMMRMNRLEGDLKVHMTETLQAVTETLQAEEIEDQAQTSWNTSQEDWGNWPPPEAPQPQGNQPDAAAGAAAEARGRSRTRCSSRSRSQGAGTASEGAGAASEGAGAAAAGTDAAAAAGADAYPPVDTHNMKVPW